MADDIRYGLNDAVAVSDIDLHDKQAVAMLLRQIIQGGWGADGGGDPVATGKGGFGPDAAKATAGASDEPGFGICHFQLSNCGPIR